MRCHYLSDLHLESQAFTTPLPEGDVLIIAGDLCHARCLDPARTDRYSIEQRDRVLRLVDEAARKFAHIVAVAGNHEHYDGIFEETTGLMRRHLPGVTVLDNESVEIGGVRFFGSTLWTDFEGGSKAAMNGVRKGMGEYFFVKTRRGCEDGTLGKFRPEDALQAHGSAWGALHSAVTELPRRTTVVITHHAPSPRGLHPKFHGNGLDPAYASRLDDQIAAFESVPLWVHGHTHIARTYQIGSTVVRSNALGFVSKGQAADGFSVKASFEVG